jgi:glycerophosphoryl diester phosphodiesterase
VTALCRVLVRARAHRRPARKTALAAALVALLTLPLGVAHAGERAQDRASHHHHRHHHRLSPCALATGRASACASIQIYGHRAIGNANENTLAALKRDAKLKVRFESDTWRLAAADGTPNAGPSVVIHDPTLRRTVDPACLGSLSPDTRVGQVTLAQWKTLCNRTGEPLPTLRQWIRKAGRWGVPGIMEVKYLPRDLAQIADWIATSGAKISFYVSPHKYHGVCNQNSAAALSAAGLTVGLKVSSACPVSLEDAAALGYDFVIGGDAADPVYVAQAHALGLRIGNYNSRRVATWTRLVDAGVDMIIAARPKRLRDWLRGT